MKTMLPRISFLYLKNTIYEYVSRRSGGQNLQGSLPITLSFQDLIEGERKRTSSNEVRPVGEEGKG